MKCDAGLSAALSDSTRAHMDTHKTAERWAHGMMILILSCLLLLAGYIHSSSPDPCYGEILETAEPSCTDTCSESKPNFKYIKYNEIDKWHRFTGGPFARIAEASACQNTSSLPIKENDQPIILQQNYDTDRIQYSTAACYYLGGKCLLTVQVRLCKTDRETFFIYYFDEYSFGSFTYINYITCGKDPGLENYKYPTFTGIWPGYGPLAGGTRVTLTGENLANLQGGYSFVFFHKDGLSVNTTEVKWDTDAFIVTTPAMDDFEPELVLDITVMTSNGNGSDLYVRIPFSFTFKEDPIIRSFQPGIIIREGGLEYSVTGKYFTSVAEPSIEIVTVVEDGINGGQSLHQTFPGSCKVVNDSLIKCLASMIGEISEETNFFMSFVFDGYTEFRIMAGSPDLSKRLDLVETPVLFPFTVPFEYDSASGERLVIQGKHLLPELKENVVVKIGPGFCNATEIFQGNISCIPPLNIGNANINSHPITVLIGNNLIYEVGEINFYYSDWKLYLPVAVAVFSVIFMFILLVTIYLKCRKGRQRNETAFPPSNEVAHKNKRIVSGANVTDTTGRYAQLMEDRFSDIKYIDES